MAATTVLYGSFFAGYGYLPRLLAVAAVATALAAVTARLRAWRAALLCVAGFTVTAVYAVLPSTLRYGLPDPSTARVNWHAVSGGWAAMLSIAAPAPDTPLMLMTPALVTWAGAFLAVTVALRTGSTLGPAAILLGAQGIGLMAAANQPITHLVQSGVFVALLVLLTSIRADGAGRRSAGAASDDRQLAPVRSPGARTAVVVLVAGVGLLCAYVSVPLMAAQRYSPRDLLMPPLRLDKTVDPLSAVRSQLRLPAPRTLFTVTVSGTTADPPGDLIQTATLDTFDGSQWSSTDSFRVAGPVLASDPGLTGARTITERISLRALTGPYLPVIGRPERIDAEPAPGAEIGFDPRSGTLVVGGDGLADPTYTVTAAIRPTNDSGVANAAVDDAAALAPYLALPAAAGPLATIAANIGTSAQTPYAKATAIKAYLRTLPCNLGAPAGDSVGALLRLLTADSPQARAGYADQHAAAFAVLARLDHLPTRIAVGYRLRPGQSTVVSADAYAWDQVYFRGYGWVDFDPTDTANTVELPGVVPVPVQTAAPSELPEPSARPSSPTAAASPTAAPDGATPTPVNFLRGNPTAGPWHVPGLIALVASALALCAAVAGTTATRRLIRRRRRRRGPPLWRLIGAWEETLDRLAHAGAPIAPSQTALEFAAHAAATSVKSPDRVGGRDERVMILAAPFLGELAAGATRAAFGGDAVTPGEADRAWMLERGLSRVLYHGRRSPRRVAYWVVPAPRRARARRGGSSTPSAGRR